MSGRGELAVVAEIVRVGETSLDLLRPVDPEALLDEEAFARDEFLPYWAELWPAGLALARALPATLEGVRVAELGCGLGVPSLVAAARGAAVTALDWAADAIALLRENATRNALHLHASVADWRSFSGSFDIVLAAIDARVPAVVGTTGWDTDAVDGRARSAGVVVFYAPNFAIGAVLMMRFAEEASRHLERAEIVELHHATKLDAPSGTAVATAARMRGEIPIHSVRLPGLVAHQEVLLGGPGQVLTIRHDATSREAYVPGVLLALAKLHELPPGVSVGLELLL